MGRDFNLPSVARRRRAAPCCVALITCFGLLACGDDDRPRYSAGSLPPDAQVSMLNDAELRQACERYDVYVDTYVDLEAVAYVACLPFALITTAAPAQCEATLQNCMATFPAPISVRGTATVDACVADLRACGTTVGRFEQCVNGRVDLALGNFSCNGAGDAGYVERTQSLVNVCGDIDAVCDRFEAENDPI